MQIEITEISPENATSTKLDPGVYYYLSGDYLYMYVQMTKNGVPLACPGIELAHVSEVKDAAPVHAERMIINNGEGLSVSAVERMLAVAVHPGAAELLIKGGR